MEFYNTIRNGRADVTGIEEDIQCRMCLQGRGPPHGDIFRYCFCGGNASAMHAPCIVAWVDSHSQSCEACGAKFGGTVVPIVTQPPSPSTETNPAGELHIDAEDSDLMLQEPPISDGRTTGECVIWMIIFPVWTFLAALLIGISAFFAATAIQWLYSFVANGVLASNWLELSSVLTAPVATMPLIGGFWLGILVPALVVIVAMVVHDNSPQIRMLLLLPLDVCRFIVHIYRRDVPASTSAYDDYYSDDGHYSDTEESSDPGTPPLEDGNRLPGTDDEQYAADAVPDHSHCVGIELPQVELPEATTLPQRLYRGTFYSMLPFLMCFAAFLMFALVSILINALMLSVVVWGRVRAPAHLDRFVRRVAPSDILPGVLPGDCTWGNIVSGQLTGACSGSAVADAFSSDQAIWLPSVHGWLVAVRISAESMEHEPYIEALMPGKAMDFRFTHAVSMHADVSTIIIEPAAGLIASGGEALHWCANLTGIRLLHQQKHHEFSKQLSSLVYSNFGMELEVLQQILSSETAEENFVLVSKYQHRASTFRYLCAPDAGLYNQSDHAIDAQQLRRSRVIRRWATACVAATPQAHDGFSHLNTWFGYEPIRAPLLASPRWSEASQMNSSRWQWFLPEEQLVDAETPNAGTTHPAMLSAAELAGVVSLLEIFELPTFSDCGSDTIIDQPPFIRAGLLTVPPHAVTRFDPTRAVLLSSFSQEVCAPPQSVHPNITGAVSIGPLEANAVDWFALGLSRMPDLTVYWFLTAWTEIVMFYIKATFLLIGVGAAYGAWVCYSAQANAAVLTYATTEPSRWLTLVYDTYWAIFVSFGVVAAITAAIPVGGAHGLGTLLHALLPLQIYAILRVEVIKESFHSFLAFGTPAARLLRTSVRGRLLRVALGTFSTSMVVLVGIALPIRLASVCFPLLHSAIRLKAVKEWMLIVFSPYLRLYHGAWMWTVEAEGVEYFLRLLSASPLVGLLVFVVSLLILIGRRRIDYLLCVFRVYAWAPFGAAKCTCEEGFYNAIMETCPDVLRRAQTSMEPLLMKWLEGAAATADESLFRGRAAVHNTIRRRRLQLEQVSYTSVVVTPPVPVRTAALHMCSALAYLLVVAVLLGFALWWLILPAGRLALFLANGLVDRSDNWDMWHPATWVRYLLITQWSDIFAMFVGCAMICALQRTIC